MGKVLSNKPSPSEGEQYKLGLLFYGAWLPSAFLEHLPTQGKDRLTPTLLVTVFSAQQCTAVEELLSATPNSGWLLEMLVHLKVYFLC